MNIGILTQDKEWGKKLEEAILSTKNKIFTAKPLDSIGENCQWIYEKYCGMVFMDFLEEDLAAIKIMESVQGKVERKISFVFLFSGQEKADEGNDQIVASLNQGALGFLVRGAPKKKMEHYVKKLIQRHETSIKEEDKGRELAISQKKGEALERSLHRLHEINRKKNRFILEHLNDLQMVEVKLLFLSNSKFRYEKFRDFFMETGFPFSISTATTVKSAEEECAETLPDIIISDYILPDGTALDLNQTIRGKQGLSTIRLMVLTSDEKNLREVEKAENKIDEAMIRPSNRDEYLELLTRILMVAILPTVSENR